MYMCMTLYTSVSDTRLQSTLRLQCTSNDIQPGHGGENDTRDRTHWEDINFKNGRRDYSKVKNCPYTAHIAAQCFSIKFYSCTK